MAVVLAAGAASCTGFLIGKLIVSQQRPPAVNLRHPFPRQPLPLLLPRAAKRAVGTKMRPRVPTPKCLLCGEEYTTGDIVLVLDCGHLQHKHCSEHWSQTFLAQGMSCQCKVCKCKQTVDAFASVEINKDKAETPRNSVVKLTQILDVERTDAYEERFLQLQAFYGEREQQALAAYNAKYQDAVSQAYDHLQVDMTARLNEVTLSLNEKLYQEYCLLREQYDRAYACVLEQVKQNQLVHEALMKHDSSNVGVVVANEYTFY